MDGVKEPIRLVIWDLDETFWQGTLLEEGAKIIQANCEIVKELAERGILSSICSKNDFEKSKAFLIAVGIWDFFVFPTINWKAKGPRLADLLKRVHLRAPTVLYIDDNHGNRNEARFFVPGIQVADEKVLSSLLSDPLLQGKNDKGLSRLNHYKNLENRYTEQENFAGDNLAFLRNSQICISIETDLKPHYPRILEMINRTNQLNFTKRRLPEDEATAFAELDRLLARHNCVAGLIRVVDKFGDYGYCGLFIMEILEGGQRHLEHFIFSCRILNMGVEHYVYNFLKRPTLDIVGEVISNPADNLEVDWINLISPKAVSGKRGSKKSQRAYFLRGGCDLAVLEHYTRMNSNQVVTESNIVRNGIPLRLDHSTVWRLALDGVPIAALEDLSKLSFTKSDFTTRIDFHRQGEVYVLSFLPDQWVSVYRHKKTGILVPFFLDPSNGMLDLCALSASERLALTQSDHVKLAMETLASSFEYYGSSLDDVFISNLRHFLLRIPETSFVFILKSKEFYGVKPRKENVAKDAIRFNRQIEAIGKEFSNVRPLATTDFVHYDGEIKEDNHYDRMVYFRLFDYIQKTVEY